MTLAIVNGVTALSSANLHLFVYGEGRTEHGMCGFRFGYNGATWDITARGSTDSGLLVTATWDGTKDVLDVDISGLDITFTGNYPGVWACPELDYSTPGTPRYIPMAYASSASDIHIGFYDFGGTQATTESTAMACYLLIFGKIS